jgi:hypothetical protein
MVYIPTVDLIVDEGIHMSVPGCAADGYFKECTFYITLGILLD